MTPWQLWLIAGIALLITEMFAPGFWLINVAVGCFAAAVVALLPFTLPLQIAVFAGATVVSAVLFRPFLLKHLHRTAVRTNVDALVGKVGMVTQRIDPATRGGRVIVDGEDWRGAAIDGTTLEPGTRIMVIEVDGTTLKVEREENP
ncbi:MAG: NfeD family protein [Gemmatimonadetes bacterium]|nr:NfeD family protein [Gemmatimonadota bacterium]